MAVITQALLNDYLDESVRLYLRTLGLQSAGNYGLGTAGAGWGAAQAVQNMIADYRGDTNLDTEVLFGDLAVAFQAAVDGATVSKALLAPLFIALSQHVTQYSLANVVGLDTYLTYSNIQAGGTWATLQHNSYRDVAIAPTPSAWNLYFEVLQGATYANALAKYVISGAGTGTFTAGFSVDTTKYAGGFGYLTWSGATGADTITITGTSISPIGGVIATGKTWTVLTAGASGSGALVPGTAPANSLIAAVSAISCANGITAGTLYVEAHRPAGRPLLP